MNPPDIFIRYLSQLLNLLEAAEEFELKGESGQPILQTRLHPDMFPCGVQAQIGIKFSLRACCPLVARPVPDFTSKTISFDNLRTQIVNTLEVLRKVPELSPSDLASVSVEEKAGFAQQVLSGDNYLYLYALPNFFFHLSMVYAILRHCGVPVSKGDFDGFHSYPPGFSFESDQGLTDNPAP